MAPAAAMKAVRMRRPASVRIGMFWRLGSDDDSRPVEVAASAYWVWMRPVAWLMKPGRRSV